MPLDCFAGFARFIHVVSCIPVSMPRSGSAGSSSRAVGSCSRVDGEVDETIPLGLPGIGLVTSGPIWGSSAKNKLEGGINSNPKSTIKLSKLRDFHSKYNIPRYISLHAPSVEVRADWDILGMVCLYELPFKSDFRFPLPRFVTEVCHRHEISPGQLTLNAL